METKSKDVRNKGLEGFINSDLTKEQINAIRKAVQTGRIIQKDFPEIADEYRSGKFHPQIAQEYCISELYGLTPAVATNAVRYALAGYNKGLKGEYSYPGLIERSELVKIAEKHQIASGKVTGRLIHELQLGVHAVDKETLRSYGVKGGVIAYKKKRGIHALTSEQKAEAARKSNKVKEEKYKQGGTFWLLKATHPNLWTPQEHARLLELCQDQNFRLFGDVRINYELIAETLNKEFYNGEGRRTSRGVAHRIEDIDVNHQLRGSLIWPEAEKLMALKLAEDPIYQKKGRRDLIKIARKLNQEFHSENNVRNAHSLNTQLYKLGKDK